MDLKTRLSDIVNRYGFTKQEFSLCSESVLLHDARLCSQVLVNLFCFSVISILFFNLYLLFQYDTSGHITDYIHTGCSHVT